LILILTGILGIYSFLKLRSPMDRGRFELDKIAQNQLDSIKKARSRPNAKAYRFNPNFISDHKGYNLGMSVKEMDRLFQFRSHNKYVSTAEEFQKVTGISDSLLNEIAPFFKFPEWVKKNDIAKGRVQKPKTKEMIKDLNSTTIEDLIKIKGIGEKLSARIIKFRDRLGGFLVNEQLYDVYGLEPTVVQNTLLRFQVLKPATIDKININTASIDELTSLVYLRYHVAKNIVNYREENGAFQSLDDLFNVPEFPVNKIDRIGLYLSY